MRWRPATGPLFAVALGMFVIAPASALGAVRLGPDLTQPLPSGGLHLGAIGCQSGQYSPCSYLNLRSTNPDVLVAAPSDGVITTWSLRGGCCTDPQTEKRVLTLATFKLGTQDGLGGYGYADKDQLGPSFEIPPGNQLLADTPLTLPAHMPIAAGERVGIIADNPIAFSVYDTIPNVTSTSITNTFSYGYVFAAALAVSAVVEPDADHDGWGDETQDCQPADPAAHGIECRPPPVTPPTSLSVGVGGSGCSGNCGSGPSLYMAPVQIPGPVPPSGDGIHFYIPLACPANATRPCGGYLVIVPAGATKAARAAATVLARAAYSVAPGKTARLRLTLNRTGRSRLKKQRRLKVVVQVRPTGGAVTTVTRTLVAKAPKKPKRR